MSQGFAQKMKGLFMDLRFAFDICIILGFAGLAWVGRAALQRLDEHEAEVARVRDLVNAHAKRKYTRRVGTNIVDIAPTTQKGDAP